MPSKPALNASTLYLGDNGRCFCGEHAGASAKYTGRDLSGQPVSPLTQLIVNDYAAEMGREVAFDCEAPTCDRSLRSEIRPGDHADGLCDLHGWPTYGGECEGGCTGQADADKVA